MKKQELKSTYERAEEWCKRVVKNGDDLLFFADKFDAGMIKASLELKFPLESLTSLLRNHHLLYVKKRSYVIRNQMHSQVLVDYVAGSSISSLAKKYHFPPSLLARGIIENITIYEKKEITMAMRNPLTKLHSVEVILDKYRNSEGPNLKQIQMCPKAALIDPFSGTLICKSDNATRLAQEVMEAINSDPMYGPRFDKERNYIGIEYEIILERALQSFNIPFETEMQLRVRGTSRTPDILFSCPVAIKVPKRILSPTNRSSVKGIKDMAVDDDFAWKMICWIDSKAMFGDVKTHQTSVLPQAETYVHRFGPGLILYWFGHAPVELLSTGHGDVLVVGWDVPPIFMMPTGEIARNGLCVLKNS